MHTQKSVLAYREALRELSDWEPYLLQHSHLPGPRGNLELLQAVAEEGDETCFRHWLMLDPAQAPENSPQAFLAVCSVVGLGTLLARASANRPSQSASADAAASDGDFVRETLAALRRFAADPRWRLREAVAMALQRWGDADMQALLSATEAWSRGTPWEQRAVAAGLCEPRLLQDPGHAGAVLRILDNITASLASTADRKCEGVRTLRQGLAYCWSVAVAACPQPGRALMEKWFVSTDRDIRWIMKENLRKQRLARMDADWVRYWQARL